MNRDDRLEQGMRGVAEQVAAQARASGVRVTATSWAGTRPETGCYVFTAVAPTGQFSAVFCGDWLEGYPDGDGGAVASGIVRALVQRLAGLPRLGTGVSSASPAEASPESARC